MFAATLTRARATPQSHPLYHAYTVLLLIGAVTVGVVSSSEPIRSGPWLFVLLVGSVVVLDLTGIDVFGRGRVSPAAVPSLALAFLFGPLGPLAGEAASALAVAARGEPIRGWGFDFGALTLSGAAAAVTFAILSPGDQASLLAAATLGGLVYYLANCFLTAPAIALRERLLPWVVWRDQMAWLWPHYLAFGLFAGMLVVLEERLAVFVVPLIAVPIAVLRIAEKQYVDRTRASVEELRRSHDELEEANRRLHGLLADNQDLVSRMKRSFVATMVSLARTIEAKDANTGNHTERVAEISADLARELGFDERDLVAVRDGAAIHDIGKIGIPDRILLKPGSLTETEFAEMRRHPKIASYILAELEVPEVVKQMCRSHHERYDGRGYPDRLAGEEIPLAARILAVADALDAMTSERPYRRASTLDVAMREIEANSGSQFCPRVVAALRALLDREAERWKAEPASEAALVALASSR